MIIGGDKDLLLMSKRLVKSATVLAKPPTSPQNTPNPNPHTHPNLQPIPQSPNPHTKQTLIQTYLSIKQINLYTSVKHILNKNYHIFVLIVIHQYVLNVLYMEYIGNIKYKLQERLLRILRVVYRK